MDSPTKTQDSSNDKDTSDGTSGTKKDAIRGSSASVSKMSRGVSFRLPDQAAEQVQGGAKQEKAVPATCNNRFLKRLANDVSSNAAAESSEDAPCKSSALLKAFGKKPDTCSSEGGAPVGADAFKSNRFLARFAAKIQEGEDAENVDDGEGGARVSKGKALWLKAKGVRMVSKAKVSAEEAQRIRRSKLVPFSRKYILCRWTIGWIINILIFAILWLGNFIYGVLHGPSTFQEVLIAWGVALFQTWVIVEPSQVLGLTLLPAVAEHPTVAKCIFYAKEYGFI